MGSNEQSPESPKDEKQQNSDEDSEAQKWDAMFADRYTEKDKEFMKVVSLKASKPPVIYPWIQNNFRRDNRQPNRNWGNRGNRDRSRSPNRYPRSSY